MKTKLTAVIVAALVLFQSGCGKAEDSKNSEAKSASPSSPAPTASLNSKQSDVKPVAAKPAPPVKSYDGPFGLAMGVSVQELLNEFQFKGDADSPNIYEGTPPKPAPGFNSYIVLASKQQGLCKISASINVSPVNDSGDQLKSETDRVAEMLELKYGKFTKKYDFASQDIYRRNSQFFMLALKDDSVTYSYNWVSGKGGLTLPNNITHIEVSAQASRIDRGYVQLTYGFSNQKECHAEIKKEKSVNF